MFALLATGPPGAGKSTALTLLHDTLGEAGVSNALIEVDEISRTYPPLPRARALTQLARLAASFRDAGHSLLLVGFTAEDRDYVSETIEACGADRHLLVRLDAPAETLRRRIEARDPATWAGRAALVEACASLAETIRGLSGFELVIDTERSDPKAVAAELERALRSSAST